MADAEIALDDPDDGIDHDDVAQQEIQRALRAGDPGHPDPIAKGFAATVQAFVAIDGVVFLHHGRQRGVSKPDGVTRGRTVECRVVPAIDACHVTTL